MKDKRQTSTPSKAEDTPASGNTSTRKGGGVISGLALVIALGACAVSAYLFTELQKFRAQTNSMVEDSTSALKSGVDSDIESVKTEISGLSSQLGSVSDDFTGKLSKMGTDLDTKTQDAFTELANSTAAAVQELTSKTESEITSLANASAEQRGTLQTELETAMSTRFENVQQSLATLRDDLHKTRDIATRGQRDWMLAEINYLLRTGGHRVRLAGDVKSAVLALRAASDRLHELGDTRYSPVRDQIAEEVAELRQVGDPDIEGVAFEIEKLSKRADALPLPPSAVEKAMEVAKEDPSEVDTRAVADQLIESLKNLVKVENSDGTPRIRPGKPTKEQLSASEVLRLNLQAARLSALRRDQETFILHMESAENYVREKYHQDDDVTRAYLEDLAVLKAQPIVPSVSKLGQALILFNEIHSKRGET
ncbi:MAG TPA: hypothetical protein DD979_04675 [Gammaproteobacteria bacterium]|jgi:uroporphyrin-3 C-methyltransferase|nr:hypothetical protein [Gammaproteobacteria bacterium]